MIKWGFIASVVLAVLKLANLAVISWWIVLAPFLVLSGIAGVILLFVIIGAVIAAK